MPFKPYDPRDKGFTSGDIKRIFKKLKDMAQVGKGNQAYYEPIVCEDWDMLCMFLEEYDEQHVRWAIRHLIVDQEICLVYKDGGMIIEIIPF